MSLLFFYKNTDQTQKGDTMFFKVLHKPYTWNFIHIRFKYGIVTDSYVQFMPLRSFTLIPRGKKHFGKENVPVIEWLNLRFGEQPIGYIKQTKRWNYHFVGPNRKRYRIHLVYTRKDRNELKHQYEKKRRRAKRKR